MPFRSLRRITVPPQLVAAASGTVAGLAVFACCAVLWQIGELHAARAAAQTAFTLVLVLVALAGLASTPTPRLLRVRVPVSRSPAQRLPAPPDDLTALLVACAGVPLFVGTALAFAIFR